MISQNKNLDSIKLIRANSQPRVRPPVIKLNLDGVVPRRPAINPGQYLGRRRTPVRLAGLIRRNFYPYIFGLTVLIFAVFASGAYFAWSTDKSFAEEPPKVMNEPAIKVYEQPQGQAAQVPSEVFFNLTLEQLENYLAEALKTPEMLEAERLEARKIKLKAYLEDRKSPFVEIVDTLAVLKHWKLVLAISNSESSLGKRCYTNNCSGIGVEPGHPYWREYETKADWAKDLDRLIERRYKDWTLEEMNGVYNQPGSRNWIMAAKQVLEELQERGIE